MSMRSVTYRPVGARIVVWVCAALLAVFTIYIGRALPDEMKFRPLETATIIVLLGVVALGAHTIGRSRVTIDEGGMTVVNGFRRRRVDWEQVRLVSMKSGAPWPTVETVTGERFILFGIQRSDHGRSTEALNAIKGHLN